jgi:hypothetical protein
LPKSTGKPETPLKPADKPAATDSDGH